MPQGLQFRLLPLGSANVRVWDSVVFPHPTHSIWISSLLCLNVSFEKSETTLMVQKSLVHFFLAVWSHTVQNKSQAMVWRISFSIQIQLPAAWSSLLTFYVRNLAELSGNFCRCWCFTSHSSAIRWVSIRIQRRLERSWNKLIPHSIFSLGYLENGVMIFRKKWREYFSLLTICGLLSLRSWNWRT